MCTFPSSLFPVETSSKGFGRVRDVAEERLVSCPPSIPRRGLELLGGLIIGILLRLLVGGIGQGRGKLHGLLDQVQKVSLDLGVQDASPDQGLVGCLVLRTAILAIGISATRRMPMRSRNALIAASDAGPSRGAR